MPSRRPFSFGPAHATKRIAVLCLGLMAASLAVVITQAVLGQAAPTATSPIFGVAIPEGYRSWQLVGVAQETGALDELRAVVANGPGIQAYQAGTLPFPDGTVLVKLAWMRQPSGEFPPAFVPGMATTVQVMVKDPGRYPETGGWGFGRFIDGRPVDEAQHRTCFACHSANVQNHDYVFTRLAP